MRTPERRYRSSRLVRILVRPAALALAILATFPSGSARAARLNYQLELTGLHSNNINLSEDNQAQESVLVPRFKFDLTEEGSAVKLHARGELERRTYTGNQFDDETRAEFAGQLNWSLFPERMNLVLEDYLSEEPIFFRDGRYPGNLQHVNIFLAGPSFFARFNDATRLQLDLRGADTYAEVSPGFDSKRYSAAAALQRDLTPNTKASLNLDVSRVNFDEPGTSPDYTRDDGFVRYEGTLHNLTYQLDAGRSRLKRDSSNDVSTSLVRATVQWQVTQQSRLRFRARHQFADEVQDLIVRLSDPDEALVPDLVASTSSLVTSGVYRQQDADVDYRFTGDRFSWRVRPLYRRLRYIDRTDADRTEKMAYFQASYRLRPLMSVFFNGQVSKRDFTNTDEVDVDHVYGLGVDYQMTRHLGWRAEAFRNKRDSNLSDPRYRETAVQFTIWWKR